MKRSALVMSYGTAVSVAVTLFLSGAARAESTRVATSTYTVVRDAASQPVAGLQGKLCYKTFFESGSIDEVCRTLSTDSRGVINFTGQAVSWKGQDKPQSYAVTFEVNGTPYTGSVPITTETRYEIDGRNVGPVPPTEMESIQKNVVRRTSQVAALWPPSCTDYGHGTRRAVVNDQYFDVPAWYDTACSQVVHFEVNLPLASGQLPLAVSEDSRAAGKSPAPVPETNDRSARVAPGAGRRAI